MGIRIGMLSTYPDTQCGIATFSKALVTHLDQAGAQVGVVRVVDTWQDSQPVVVHQWRRGQCRSLGSAAQALNSFDVAVVQHEYGIFGGPDGADVIDLLDLVDVPVIAVLHTVLTHPTPHQHRVLADLVARANALVTMTATARDRLVTGWAVDSAMVTIIPHGAEDNRGSNQDHDSGQRWTVLTWGLLSQGKGIEWALRGLARLKKADGTQGTGMPRYQVVGRTHPLVVERDGEAYREMLQDLTRHLGLSDDVTFDDRYLRIDDLQRVVRGADLVLLPYESLEQVTSGVLTEAIAAGKPVISTSFPHAVELLATGAGILVPQRDPEAIAAALHTALTVDGAADGMAREARRLATSLLWPTVAERYLALAESVLMRPPTVVSVRDPNPASENAVMAR